MFGLLVLLVGLLPLALGLLAWRARSRDEDRPPGGAPPPPPDTPPPPPIHPSRTHRRAGPTDRAPLAGPRDVRRRVRV